VIDDFTKQCHAMVVDTSISGYRVARELTDLHGRPEFIVCDNGTEFTSMAMFDWVQCTGGELSPVILSGTNQVRMDLSKPLMDGFGMNV